MPIGDLHDTQANANSPIDEEMSKHVLQEPFPELETIDEAHFTWQIEGWRSMERKVHSPVFECGGYPWLVPW